MNTIKTNTSGLKIKTSIKAGGLSNTNHNRTLVIKPVAAPGLKVRTHVKAAGFNGSGNHNRMLLA